MISIPSPAEIPVARVPIWVVLVALAAGWASGYNQAAWSARAEASESALDIVTAAADNGYSRGVAAALVSCAAEIEAARRELADEIDRRLECRPIQGW